MSCVWDTERGFGERSWRSPPSLTPPPAPPHSFSLSSFSSPLTLVLLLLVLFLPTSLSPLPTTTAISQSELTCGECRYSVVINDMKVEKIFVEAGQVNQVTTAPSPPSLPLTSSARQNSGPDPFEANPWREPVPPPDVLCCRCLTLVPCSGTSSLPRSESDMCRDA